MSNSKNSGLNAIFIEEGEEGDVGLSEESKWFLGKMKGPLEEQTGGLWQSLSGYAVNV